MKRTVHLIRVQEDVATQLRFLRQTCTDDFEKRPSWPKCQKMVEHCPPSSFRRSSHFSGCCAAKEGLDLRPMMSGMRATIVRRAVRKCQDSIKNAMLRVMPNFRVARSTSNSFLQRSTGRTPQTLHYCEQLLRNVQLCRSRSVPTIRRPSAEDVANLYSRP